MRANRSLSVYLGCATIMLLLASCGLVGGDERETAEQLALTMVAGTAAVEEQKASGGAVAATTQPPTEPSPPTEAPTVVPTPNPTNTPGPLSLTDDFSSDSGYWDCTECTLEGGRLHFGPFDVSGAYIQHYVICEACGMVTSYRMAADVTFGGGPSERGYGFLVRGREERLLTYEITPWQDLDFWKFEFATNRWNWINGIFAGAVRTGNQTNRMEVRVTVAASGGTDFALSVNGRTPLVIFNQPAEPGIVGLTLFGHAVDIWFDNFEFETTESPTYPNAYDWVDA